MLCNKSSGGKKLNGGTTQPASGCYRWSAACLHVPISANACTIFVTYSYYSSSATCSEVQEGYEKVVHRPMSHGAQMLVGSTDAAV